MILADTVSCLPNPDNNDEIQLDARVDGIEEDIEDPSNITLAIINFSTPKQQVIQEKLTRDPSMSELKEFIVQGWPSNIKELPAHLLPYWSFRDELAIEAGIIFKGRQILIPESMRADILA